MTDQEFQDINQVVFNARRQIEEILEKHNLTLHMGKELITFVDSQVGNTGYELNKIFTPHN